MRKLRQKEKLFKDKETTRKLQLMNKPLGPKHRILGIHRDKFKEAIEEVTGEDVGKSFKMNTLTWRNFLVRLVCSSEGKREDLRTLWSDIYKGDLRWGIRDERRRAKEQGWPERDTSAHLQHHDRNSWIAYCLKKSLQSS